ncbi:hypothetical protein ACIHEJ_30130 [Streptomyces sp. NPDC052301]|uniref:hypothetical protein n=1 Tax=Streptomyces sp. NPDC052301 TaxID=3365687 RepID=UPI0037CD6945
MGAFWLTREPETMERLPGAQHTLLKAFDPRIWTDEERRARVVRAIGSVTATMRANRDAQWISGNDVVVAAGLGALGHAPAAGTPAADAGQPHRSRTETRGRSGRVEPLGPSS